MPTSSPESQALLRRYRNANGFRGHPNETHASLRASFSVAHIITPPGAVLVEITLQTQGKTINREVVIALDEKSVKARKVRKRSRNDFMKCTQTAYIFYNSLTQVNYRENKHFPGTSNMSNTLGPVTLMPWANCTKLAIKDKKEFWGARRRAVGGRTEGASESGGSDDESEQA